MKTALTTIFAATLTLMSYPSALACTITPQADSRLRVIALNDSLGQMEFMNGFTTQDQVEYKVAVHSSETNTDEVRIYKLENTSPMCPVYKVTRLK